MYAVKDSSFVSFGKETEGAGPVIPLRFRLSFPVEKTNYSAGLADTISPATDPSSIDPRGAYNQL